MTPHEAVTQYVLNALKNGVVPWRANFRHVDQPCNGQTGHVYSGVNRMLAMFDCALHSRPLPYYLTFNQVSKLDGKIQKGEKGLPVIYMQPIDSEKLDSDGNQVLDENGAPEVERTFFLRQYRVWNVGQTDLDPQLLAVHQTPSAVSEASFSSLDKAEMIIGSMPDPPQFREGSKPCYVPSKDVVILPPRSQYLTPEGYFYDAFHELGHASGHQDRLARPSLIHLPGSTQELTYAQEELVAEMCALFLAAETGIDTSGLKETGTAYIEGWLKTLGQNPRWVVWAAAQASKAANCVLGQDLEISEEVDLRDDPEQGENPNPEKRERALF